jgi:hypothetical protein
MKKIKELLKRILRFISDTSGFIYFLLGLMYWRRFSNPIKEKYAGALCVLANGPSLKDVLPLLITTNEFKNVDFIVMNFFAVDDSFLQIKPKHYCLADPMFFMRNYNHAKVVKLFEVFETKVGWDMNIYIVQGYNGRKGFLDFSQITNPYIKVIPINNTLYRGFEQYRFFFYKKGLSCPLIASVVVQAIYVGINLGYSKIYLHGVDHNFFNTLYVNNKNQLCNKISHFYGEEKNLKPIIKNEENEFYRFHEYLSVCRELFYSHELCAQYANYMGVKIVNCTKGSMIDSYERK